MEIETFVSLVLAPFAPVLLLSAGWIFWRNRSGAGVDACYWLALGCFFAVPIGVAAYAEVARSGVVEFDLNVLFSYGLLFWIAAVGSLGFGLWLLGCKEDSL